VVLSTVKTTTAPRERNLPIPQELRVESPQLQPALHLLRKQIKGKAVMFFPDPEHSKLLMVRNKISQKWFLVDAGASVSVLPPNKDWKISETVTKLLAANGTIEKTYRKRDI